MHASTKPVHTASNGLDGRALLKKCSRHLPRLPAPHLAAFSLPSLPRRSACHSCSSASPSRNLLLLPSSFASQEHSQKWLLCQPRVSISLSMNLEGRFLASCLWWKSELQKLLNDCWQPFQTGAQLKVGA